MKKIISQLNSIQYIYKLTFKNFPDMTMYFKNKIDAEYLLEQHKSIYKCKIELIQMNFVELKREI